VRVPPRGCSLGDSIKVGDGKLAEIKVENGTLLLRPIVKPARRSAARSA
jgi:hypothetical protein